MLYWQGIFDVLVAKATNEVTQSCPTLCDLILQAGILEWIAAPFSRGSSKPRD